jgi:hypothetical protein
MFSCTKAQTPAQAPTPRFNVIPTNTYGQTAQIAADAGLKAAQARLAVEGRLKIPIFIRNSS